jgi:hypothetical protein
MVERRTAKSNPGAQPFVTMRYPRVIPARDA